MRRRTRHPKQQVWIHVDYSGHRAAYIRFGMPEIPANCVLDHVQTREAIRLRGYFHPYLRLCPISRQVNTSGGTNTGGEGMEKEFLRSLPDQPEAVQESVRDALKCDIVYADPVDLTKMLDISPGTQVLAGVGEFLKLFYPEQSSPAQWPALNKRIELDFEHDAPIDFDVPVIAASPSRPDLHVDSVKDSGNANTKRSIYKGGIGFTPNRS